jgi:exopolyphosphatase/guanosine-5'-triphosphate,3'-diphosphate pyrophosphatase
MTQAGSAPGRLPVGDPVAIVDIGSNSVRLVAYEGLTRAPTPIFNEKVLCGLGRGVAITGRLSEDGIERALASLRRFRILCRGMAVKDIHVLATAAARDAVNGPQFLETAQEAIGCEIELLSGRREAELSALGVVSSIHAPDGIVGDLGGGSLELIGVKGTKIGKGVSLQLGSLSLIDRANRSIKRATRIVRDALAATKAMQSLEGRSFYAVGGTWRALARLHMAQHGYPLHVMHGYVIPASDAAIFARLVEDEERKTMVSIGAVSPARRPLLSYGALVLEQIIARARPKNVIVSALGVREGLLYDRLDPATRREDPLLSAAREINLLRSRSPRHGEELCGWTDTFFKSSAIRETANEVRLRHAACLLADTSWRAHPDYRGEQSLNIIMHSALIGIDHPGRVFLALCAAYRHLFNDDVAPGIRAIVPELVVQRARILGGVMRVAYIVTAAMSGILPRAPLRCVKTRLVLTLPRDLADLASERLYNRMRQLAKLIDREAVIEIGASGASA